MARGRRRRIAALAAIGIGAYLIALIASLPARLVIDPGTRWAVGGTIWRGEAILAGAYRITWAWAPLRSILSLALAADWRMDGDGTAIAGKATAGPRRLLLENVVGRGDGALLATIARDLPFSCDAVLTIDLPRVSIAGAASAARGEIRSHAGTCLPAGGAQSVSVPALVARANGDVADVTMLTIAPLRAPQLRLLDGRLADGLLTAGVTPAGAGLIPFLRGFRIEQSVR